MRIVFMGTPEFAVPSLDILVKTGYNVVAVVTSADSYGGRGGRQLIESAVKKYAIEHHIPILQPVKLRDPEFLDALRAFRADIQIVVAFRMLPEVVWNMPPLGSFNLHGSLLPKYRGAAPIHHAIINGDTLTGVTSFKLQHKIDTGDILIQKSLPIEAEDDTGSLHDKMMILGAEVVLETVRLIESGDYTFLPQNHEEVTHAPKIFHNTCQIDFHQPVRKVYNFIRGHSPYPGAWTRIEGKEIKIFKAQYETKDTDNKEPGSIETNQKNTLKIKCLDGYIDVLEIKPEGKRKMSLQDYLNGQKIEKLEVEKIVEF